MSGSPKSKVKTLREPPPSLFLGPPSQNASHVSLPSVTQPALPSSISFSPSRAPLIRQRSARIPARLDTDVVPPSLPRNRQNSEIRRQADRTDAQWAEMQSTLEEVELSAVNGNHVFGPEHTKALDALRIAQIDLAKAWARSEADEAVESTDKESKGFSAAKGTEGKSLLETVGTEAGKGSTAKGSTAASAVGVPVVERFGSGMKEDTDADILLARRRREANDKYFQRVNGGVLDVVAKLEEVANAMKAVEQESRDIWGETESDGTSLRD